MRQTDRFLKAVAFSAAITIAASPSSAQEECSERLNFEDIDIGLVIDEIAQRTGKKFVVDPRVEGKVTIKSGAEAGLCADESWELFLAALRVNGFTATPISIDTFKIVPAQLGVREAGPVNEDGDASYVTQIIRLDYVDAREAAGSITQIVGETGLVSAVASTNSVIVVDTPGNVERVREIINRIDRDSTVVETFALTNIAAAEAARAIGALASRLSEEGDTGASKIQTTPIASSNRLLVRARPEAMARVREIVDELDRVGSEGASLSVIQLAHADAEVMVGMLKNLAGATSAQPAAIAAEGGPAIDDERRPTLTAYLPTNSIIIFGDADTQRTLKGVIAQLDVRRQQVLVEAIIVEVSDATARELGINYFAADKKGERVVFSANAFGDAERRLLSNAGAALLESDPARREDLAQRALDSLLGVSGFSLGGAATFGSGQIFGAILTAVKDDDRSRVLSFPSVVTLDNEPATLSVGQEIPITTGETVGDDFTNTFRTVSREEVGIILKVTPHINAGGTITLKIDQESSSVAGQIISSSTDLITNKRAITTTSVVDDGDILVIGGLVDQTDESFETKTPVLGDMPVVGNLFKSTSRSRSNRNLMVFIRPSILASKLAARVATAQKLDYLSTAADRVARGRGPTLRQSIEDVTGSITATKSPRLEDEAGALPAAPNTLPEATAEETRTLGGAAAVIETSMPEAAIEGTPAPLVQPPIHGPNPATPTPGPNAVASRPIALASIFFGAHLGSYRTVASAAEGWRALLAEYPMELDALSPRVAAFEDPLRGEFQRLIAGPFRLEDEAGALCGRLKDAGDYCAVMPFSGRRVDGAE